MAYMKDGPQKQKRPPVWEAAWILEARAGVEPTYTDLQSGKLRKLGQGATRKSNGINGVSVLACSRHFSLFDP